MTEEISLNPTDHAIIDSLEGGRCTPSLIAEESDYTRGNVKNRLDRLVEHGMVKKVHRGLYELVNDPRKPTTEIPPREVTLGETTVRERDHYAVSGPVPNLWDESTEYSVTVLAIVEAVGDASFGLLILRGDDLDSGDIHYVPGGEFVEALQDGRVEVRPPDE